MDGILKSFEHCLQMLDPRLERLQPVLPIDLWRPSALSRPAVTAPPHSTQALCDRRDRGRLCRPWAWRSLGFDPSLHCSAAPDPLLGCRAKGKRNESRRANRRLAARVSIICLELRAWARSRFSAFRAFGLSAEVLPAESAAPQATPFPAPAQRRCAPALAGGQRSLTWAAWGSHAGIGRTKAPVVSVATKTPAATITATPHEHRRLADSAVAIDVIKSSRDTGFAGVAQHQPVARAPGELDDVAGPVVSPISRECGGWRCSPRPGLRVSHGVGAGRLAWICDAGVTAM